jgi:hypothetical protein
MQNTDTTKFCRQCGLSLQQITGYLATGGTGSLTPPVNVAPPPPHFPETSEMLALKQKRTMTILSVCIAPIILAVITDNMLGLGDLAGIPFLLVPLGIMWASFRYKTQLRRLQEQQIQQYYERQQYYQQPLPQSPAPKLVIQPSAVPPGYTPVDQPQMNAPRTNPLADTPRGSVIEDETRKLPEQSR